MAKSAPEGVTALLDPVVAGTGLVLEGVTITPAGKRRVVRVVVDLPEHETGSVDLDRVAEVARTVSEALDGSDVLGGQAYVLEVSSPGVDRPLTERRHWARARGRLVVAALADGGEASGRLVEVSDDGVVLDTDAGHRELTWAETGRGTVQVEFRRPEPVDGADTPHDDGTDVGELDDETDEKD